MTAAQAASNQGIYSVFYALDHGSQYTNVLAAYRTTPVQNFFRGIELEIARNRPSKISGWCDNIPLCGDRDAMTRGFGCDNTACLCFPNEAQIIQITYLPIHVRETNYISFMWTRMVICLQMPWPLTLSAHKQTLYWVCAVGKSSWG